MGNVHRVHHISLGLGHLATFCINSKAMNKHCSIKIRGELVSLEVLTAVTMNTAVLWDVTKCRPLDVYLQFGEMCSFHLQDKQYSPLKFQRYMSINIH